MSDSSTGGYLVPSGNLFTPEEDTTLEDILQSMVAGITGLPGTNVRPRWQPLVPGQLPDNVNWAAIGVLFEEPDTYGTVTHDPTGDGGLGVDTLTRHETIMVMASFYGPMAQAYAKRLTNGLLIEQNREALGLVGIKVNSVGMPRNVPEEVNTRFIRRADLEINLRRIMTSIYPVRTILSTTQQTNHT